LIKRLLILMLICCCAGQAFAGHIAGGEMYYQYVGAGSAANTNKYLITLRLFRECHPVGQAAQLPDVVRISIFRSGSNITYVSKDVGRSNFIILQLNSPLTCIVNKPEVCYQVAYFSFTVDLPVIAEEYIAAYQTCCRSNSILNVQQYAIPGSPLPGEGSTYTCNIPGTNAIKNGVNSSAVFDLKDTVLVCSEKKMNLDFSATDPDGDSLSYSFCAAYNRGASTDASIISPSPPPYQTVTYKGNYTGESPMGSGIMIDPITGKINGRAPAAGVYVVNVCVAEWRKGAIISVHHKDFIIRVSNCDFAAAELEPSYTMCDDFKAHFENESPSSGIHSYYWDFGTNGDTSSAPTPDYTYKDTGVYIVKLVVNRGEGCSDSTITKVNVFPVFKPAFKETGGCYKSPVQFTDATSTTYGVVNSWHWDFGDNTTNADTAHTNKTSYQYPGPGDYNVNLTVTNSKGCVGSVTDTVTLTDKPTLILPFKDTLICKGDTLQLGVSSDVQVAYNWLPAYNQLNSNTARPLVYPASTTAYSVTANDGKGCIGTDTVQVRVADGVDLQMGRDSVICLTDTVQFHPKTNALYFSWSPANAVDNANIEEPYAIPMVATTYHLHAVISKKCFMDGALTIRPAPYPNANAGSASTICYGYTAQLNASYAGSVFAWSPTNNLLHANTLTPTAGPQETTTYTLMARDTTAGGCPKPVYDTVIVHVIPPVHVFAGSDTNIVVMQPLHLKATGAEFYQWTPTTGMTSSETSEPVVILDGTVNPVTYHVKGTTAEGCSGYDTLTVYVYKTLPEVFVPTAFTPNNDGLNDKLIPVLAGIKKLEIFSIYNRWGQLLYTTSAVGQGWDGTVAGNKQPAGSYIYVVKAIDYLDKHIIKKGSVVIIR
jgi:gliding motility-associated-like protein